MTIDQRIEFLLQSAESHDRQIGELTEGLASLRNALAIQTANIDKLVIVTKSGRDRNPRPVSDRPRPRGAPVGTGRNS